MYTKSIIRRKAYTKGEAISKYQNQDCIFVYNYRPSTLDFFELNFRFHFLANWCEIC